MPKKLTIEEFISKSKVKHGDMYGYSEVEYITSLNKVNIICKKHGSFLQLPKVHIRGGGCPKCKGENCSKRLSQSKIDVLNRMILKHNGRYTYPEFEYKGTHSKINICCEKHGIFKQNISKHLRGQGCDKCAGKNITTSEIIKKFENIHNDKYGYYKVDYKDTHSKVIINCKNHGDFKQTPHAHISGKQGCPKCAMAGISKSEIELQKFIKTICGNINVNNRDIIKPYELDIYIPELNKAIEFNGTYWHYHSDHFVPGKHARKSNLCRNLGIKLLYIREDLWTRDRNKMKQVIQNFLEK